MLPSIVKVMKAQTDLRLKLLAARICANLDDSCRFLHGLLQAVDPFRVFG